MGAVDLASSSTARIYPLAMLHRSCMFQKELLPGLEKQAPLRAAKSRPMQSFSLGKRRKNATAG